MKRFLLNPESILVKGAKRGAIYDLKSNNVYSIDEQATAILEQHQLSSNVESLFGLKNDELNAFLTGLKSLELGYFAKANQQPIRSDLTLFQPKLYFAWLELTSKCNQKCIHCYTESDDNNPPLKSEVDLSLSDWQKALQDLISLNCKKIQFIGGEPLLFGNGLFDLILRAKNLGFEFIELYTNATLLTDQNIDFLSDHSIAVATSIYANNSEVHDKIARKKGSFKKTIEAIKKMRDNKITIRTAMVVSKYNQDIIQETVLFMNDLCGYKLNHPYDIARPIGRGTQGILSDKLCDMRLVKKPCFLKTTKNDFIKRLSYNSCWIGKICITFNGDVIPCIMARKEIAGNIKDNSLDNIVQNSIKKYWQLNKDQIIICKDCEFRYTCNDCRPLVRGVTNNLYSKSPDCLYNPYDGVWIEPKKEVIDEQIVNI